MNSLSLRKPWLCARFAVALVVVASLGCGCGDDDGGMDGGPIDGGPDSGRLDSGLLDAGDAEFDAGTCKTASPSAYGAVREDWWLCTVVPLNVLFPQNRAPVLVDFEARLDCNAGLDGGVDADGGDWRLLRRTEGCGTVVFENVAGSWPRLYVFDAATGTLVAGARIDDIGAPDDPPSCTEVAYVAGSLRASCPSDVVQYCL